MPRLTRPPAMPGEVEAAIETVGNRARAELLRTLAIHGPLTLSELADELGASRTGTHHHLVALEQHGLVRCDRPPEERRGRTVRWSLVPGAGQKMVDALAKYIAGH